MLEARYPGIVIQAVALTFGTLAALLLAYRSGLIPVTKNFRMGVVAATGGIAIFYLVAMGLSFFGIRIAFLHEGSWLGIGVRPFLIPLLPPPPGPAFDCFPNSPATCT